MCVYCEGNEFQKEWSFEIAVDGYFLTVENICTRCKDIQSTKFLINYCPYCGEKL